MSEYAEVDEVREILTRNAATTSGNAASISDETIRRNVTDASAEIDATLAANYTTPFAPVPDLIKYIAEGIAAYLSDLTFRENRDYETELNPVYLRYQRSRDLLTKLATGELIIPPEGAVPEPGQGNRVVQTITRGALITSCDFDIRIGNPCSPDYTTAEGWATH